MVLCCVRPNLTRRRAEQRGLRLWPVGTVLVLTFVTAIFVAAVVFTIGWDLLGARELKPERLLDSSTLFDLVKLSFGVVAGAGALVALVVAYRRQRVDEDGALRDATRLHTERFTTAVSQLGEQSGAVRLGGVHALAGLADDAPTRALRQTCIDVLCAYLRLPYTAEADLTPGDAAARHEYLASREVRHTIIRLIRDHLRLALEHPHSWQGHDLDFTGVVFDGGDLSGAVFSDSTVTFGDALFSNGAVNFTGAEFSRGASVDFCEAMFSGGTVAFDNATVSSGTVSFADAKFVGGTVSFTRSTFSGGIVTFDHAEFSIGADFHGAVFSGADVDFQDAEFSRGADFRDAAFSGGTVSLVGADFPCGVMFSGATFSGGTVALEEVTVSGDPIFFCAATFSGSRVLFTGAGLADSTVDFGRATFSGGTLNFDLAVLTGGTVDLDGATFSGGVVDFSHADGGAPARLIPPGGESAPTGLSLPPAWDSPTH